MNVMRFYSLIGGFLVLLATTLVLVDLWKWAIVVGVATLALVAVAVSALIQQQFLTADLLRQQNNALMAFFKHQGVRLEDQG